jgi:hypothetical protein
MRDFDAVITRDGAVYHLAWANHLQTIAHFKIPENVSEWRQNYYEYDIHAPFTEVVGLQPRGIEEPPEEVIRSAERLTGQLRNWHRGLDLRSIPEDWGDVVEHVYEVLGPKRTPKYLNGWGGVYFCGALEEVRDGHIRRLLGTARVARLAGASCVDQMWGQSRVDEMRDAARIGEMRESARVSRMLGRSQVGMMCNSSSVEEMRGESRVLVMFGASRALGLYDSARCARAYDSTVYTTLFSHAYRGNGDLGQS